MLSELNPFAQQRHSQSCFFCLGHRFWEFRRERTWASGPPDGALTFRWVQRSLALLTFRNLLGLSSRAVEARLVEALLDTRAAALRRVRLPGVTLRKPVTLTSKPCRTRLSLWLVMSNGSLRGIIVLFHRSCLRASAKPAPPCLVTKRRPNPNVFQKGYAGSVGPPLRGHRRQGGAAPSGSSVSATRPMAAVYRHGFQDVRNQAVPQIVLAFRLGRRNKATVLTVLCAMLSSMLVLRVLLAPHRLIGGSPKRGSEPHRQTATLTWLLSALVLAVFGASSPYADAGLQPSTHATHTSAREGTCAVSTSAGCEQAGATLHSATLQSESRRHLQAFDPSNLREPEVDATRTADEREEGPEEPALGLARPPHVASRLGRSCSALKPHERENGRPLLEWLHAQRAPRGPPQARRITG